MNWILGLISVVLAIMSAYYAARVYTRNIPSFGSSEPIQLAKSDSEYDNYYQYIDTKSKYATYENIVIEMRGGAPDKNYFCILRDVVANGIKIKNFKDMKEASAKPGAFEVNKAAIILYWVSFRDILSRKGKFLVVHDYNETAHHFVVEVRLDFRESKPLFVWIKSQEETPTTWRISWKTTLHELKIF